MSEELEENLNNQKNLNSIMIPFKGRWKFRKQLKFGIFLGLSGIAILLLTLTNYVPYKEAGLIVGVVASLIGLIYFFEAIIRYDE